MEDMVVGWRMANGEWKKEDDVLSHEWVENDQMNHVLLLDENECLEICLGDLVCSDDLE